MRKVLLIILLSVGVVSAQKKITVIFNNLEASKMDTLFFDIKNSECSDLLIEQISRPHGERTHSEPYGPVYLPYYVIEWERHPIMGYLMRYTEYNDYFGCIANYLYENKDKYIKR